MTVCRQLDIFYLWVDALCITQRHNGAEWKDAASSIQHIYGNAHLTLDVLSADSASDGFLDRLMPGDYQIDKCMCRICNGLYPFPARKGLAEVKADSPCAQRGWVFQEELLPPRILYWSSQGLFWSCSEHEDAQNGTPDTGKDEWFNRSVIPEMLTPHRFRTSRDPLFLWDDMISMYSLRDSRLHSDRLPAVHGLADIIVQSH